MSRASVLVAGATTGSRYSLVLSTDHADIDGVQRLRYQVFTTEPGFALTPTPELFEGRDADRFDEFCDHLLVRDDRSGDIVGCYRMLPPPGAIAAGGLYTATEFDISACEAMAPQTVEMGRAVVRADHRSGAVLALMWSGILAYLERSGYRYVVGCVSVPIAPTPEAQPAAAVRGIRDELLSRFAAEEPWRVTPHRPVSVGGRLLDEIAAPATVKMPPLLRGYLRIGARICGEPSHDPDFGVADFVAMLDRERANVRYLDRLRASASSMELS